MTLNEVLDLLWQNFNNCRAYFPFMPQSALGERALVTAPLYQSQGFKVRFEYDRTLDQKVIDKNNEIAGWINENFLIRLCAVLESFGVLSNAITLDKSIDGWKHVDIVRRLRNHFAHSSGRYDPDNDDHRRLLNSMGELLGVQMEGSTAWDLSIDTVLKPLFEGCKTYAAQRQS